MLKRFLFCLIFGLFVFWELSVNAMNEFLDPEEERRSSPLRVVLELSDRQSFIVYPIKLKYKKFNPESSRLSVSQKITVEEDGRVVRRLVIAPTDEKSDPSRDLVLDISGLGGALEIFLNVLKSQEDLLFGNYINRICVESFTPLPPKILKITLNDGQIVFFWEKDQSSTRFKIVSPTDTSEVQIIEDKKKRKLTFSDHKRGGLLFSLHLYLSPGENKEMLEERLAFLLVIKDLTLTFLRKPNMKNEYVAS